MILTGSLVRRATLWTVAAVVFTVLSLLMTPIVIVSIVPMAVFGLMFAVFELAYMAIRHEERTARFGPFRLVPLASYRRAPLGPHYRSSHHLSRPEL